MSTQQHEGTNASKTDYCVTTRCEKNRQGKGYRGGDVLD